MRRIIIARGDFALFHSDINPVDFEFFRTHAGAFKRMWNEQTRQFWVLFVDMFDHFIWKYGVMKDFPLKIGDVRNYVDEIISLVQLNFVEGNASSAKAFVTDCAIVAQNRHYIGGLDKAPYSQNPFYIKDTRETFRKLFGPPRSKTTFMKVLCGLPIYVKFAGAAVTSLRRWLAADDIEDYYCVNDYLLQLSVMRSEDKSSLDTIERTIIDEKKKEKADQPTKRVSKKHFANEETKQKALEWADSSSTNVSCDLEELDPPPFDKPSYKSSYKQAIQSVTEDFRNSLVESIAEAKQKEIELAKERGEDVEPLIEEFKASLDKRKIKRKKKGKGDDEISALLALHKEISSSDKRLENTVGTVKQPSILDLVEKLKPPYPLCSADSEKPSHITDLVKPPYLTEVKLDSVDEVKSSLTDSANQSSNGSVKRYSNDSINQSSNESVDLVKQSSNESVDLVKQSFDESVDVVKHESLHLVKKSSNESVKNSKQFETYDIALDDITINEEKQQKNELVLLQETTSTKQDDDEVLSGSYNEINDGKKKLHLCSFCYTQEVVAKSFKRCVKCRRQPNPRYYCSKDCQINDWKAGHRLDHADI